MSIIVLIIHPPMSYGHFLLLKPEYSGTEKYCKEMIFFEETKTYPNSYQLRIEKSSRQQIFFKIGAIGVLSLKAYKFIKNRLQHRCFAVKFAKFLENLFLQKTLVAAFELISTFCSCLNTCFAFVILYLCLLNKQCAGDKKDWNEI